MAYSYRLFIPLAVAALLPLSAEMFESSHLHESNNLPSSPLSWSGWMLMAAGVGCVYVGYRQWPILLLALGTVFWFMDRRLKKRPGRSAAR
jgi:hypothetical protein